MIFFSIFVSFPDSKHIQERRSEFSASNEVQDEFDGAVDVVDKVRDAIKQLQFFVQQKSLLAEEPKIVGNIKNINWSVSEKKDTTDQDQDIGGWSHQLWLFFAIRSRHTFLNLCWTESLCYGGFRYN